MQRRTFLASAATFTLAAITALPVLAAKTTMKGKFRGDSNHVTTGGVTVEMSPDTAVITLESNFEFDGAPDPRVAFGKNGKFTRGTDFAPLKKNSGKQTYNVPANIDAREYDTVVIWCRRFSVPLGHARLS